MVNLASSISIGAFNMFTRSRRLHDQSQDNDHDHDHDQDKENLDTAAAVSEQSLEGSGNNIDNPTWGAINQPFIRQTPARYADGISTVGGVALASPRVISNLVFPSPDEGVTNDRDFSAMTYAWGQFVDHDMMLTAAAAPVETMEFAVSSGDDVFDKSASGTKTMSSSRSNFDSATGTSATNPRQQVNSLTSFTDGSQVYGETSARASSLRENVGGRMSDGGIDLLPRLTNASDLFLTGDVRGNENPELCSLHVLFVREHNRVAAQIAASDPTLSDEELYQRARRFVIALLQKVTYSEFLPALLGSANLPPYSGYRSTVNPGISNEFGAAVFRLGHSMLSNDVEFMDDNGVEVFPAMSLRRPCRRAPSGQQRGSSVCCSSQGSVHALAQWRSLLVRESRCPFPSSRC